jgi:hypothetical protein
MKKGMVIANTILAFPFIYILFCALLSWIAAALHLGGELNGEITDLLVSAPLILAYVFLPDVGPVLLPLLTALTSFSIWKFWPQRRILLGCYLMVSLLYDAYLVWWYATGQKVHLEL